MSDTDLAELRDSLRAALTRLAPVQQTLANVEDEQGFDPAVWGQLSDQLQLPGLGLPEKYGGQGFGTVEEGIALEETGRVLYPGPHLASVLAARAILDSADDRACSELLPGIAAGTTIATVAATVAAEPAVRAEGGDGQARLTGRCRAVIAAAEADLLLVPIEGAAGRQVTVVERNAPGLTITPLPVLDLTRRLASVAFDGTPARVLASPRSGSDLVGALRTRALAASAADQAGAARGALDMTIEYARVRVQFGREIGSFQAVRHRLADLHTEVELAAAMARSAVAEPDPFDPAAIRAALAAYSLATETFLRVSAETIQLHGGIGFTWEHPAHLYFKRAKSSELLLGGPESARVVLGDLIGAGR